MIGKTVKVVVDRPLGTYHPKHKDIFYTVNYGYVEGVMAPDGEEQDVYILGVDKPVKEFEGRIIAIIHRYDDVEEKWVVAPENVSFTKEEIMEKVAFQEKFFQSEVRMAEISMNARSSIRIAGTKVIYFDPFKIIDAKHDADVVFVTHEHFDHFSPEDIGKVSNNNTLLVAPYSMQQKVCEEIGKIVGAVKFIKAEETETCLMLEDMLVKWVYAYNVGKSFHLKEHGWVGYIVTLDGETYYVTGDTDLNEDNVNVECDVLFVPCGGKYTFNAEEAAVFTSRVKPRKAIPTHYTDTAGDSEIAERYKAEVNKLTESVEVEVIL